MAGLEMKQPHDSNFEEKKQKKLAPLAGQCQIIIKKQF